MSRFMTAQQAADALGVAVPTIYAYVSRGLIRSEEADGSKRTRRYYAEDIEQMIQHKEATRNPEKAAEEALHWGMPLLESALTLIDDDGPHYRGRSAVELARTHRIEQVAALLWTTDINTDVFTEADHPAVDDCLRVLASVQSPYMTGLGAMQMVLPVAASLDLTAYDLHEDAIIRAGARILRLLGAVVIGGRLGERDLAAALAVHWSRPDAEGLISAALVLGADHELNASSFTARVVAGAGANPYAVVIAGLSAFQGIKHGGATERAAAFLRAVSVASNPRAAIADHLRRGESIPGFGHPIYADGRDPRGAALLELLAEYDPDAQAITLVTSIAEMIDRPPNIDAAMAALTLALDLPTEAGGLIFALGRVTGWIAHAIEQYDGRMIRPRARYVGPPIGKRM